MPIPSKYVHIEQGKKRCSYRRSCRTSAFLHIDNDFRRRYLFQHYNTKMHVDIAIFIGTITEWRGRMISAVVALQRDITIESAVTGQNTDFRRVEASSFTAIILNAESLHFQTCVYVVRCSELNVKITSLGTWYNYRFVRLMLTSVKRRSVFSVASFERSKKRIFC